MSSAVNVGISIQGTHIKPQICCVTLECYILKKINSGHGYFDIKSRCEPSQCVSDGDYIQNDAMTDFVVVDNTSIM